MSEWQSFQLDELADIRVSNVDKKSQQGERSVRLCNYMDVYSNDYITSSLEFMEATASAAECEKFKVEQGDVLITKDSETPDDIGIPSVVVNEIEDLVCGYHLALIKPNRNAVNPIFLSKQLASANVSSYFSRMAAGSTRYGLSNGAIGRTRILVPSLVKQKKIAVVLLTIDQTIEKTEALIEKYQQIKAGLMHDLFTRGIGSDGKLRPSREQAPELYQQTPIGWIPKEWDLRSVEELGGLVTSGSRDWAKYYSDEGDIFVRIGNLTREHINFRFDKIQFVAPLENSDGQRTRLMSGDILVSITADLGIVGVIPEALGDAYINQHIALIRFPTGKINSRYVGHYFSTTQFQKYVASFNDSGAKAGLNLPSVRGFSIATPVASEQKWITDYLDIVDNKVQKEKDHLAKLENQKSGLMHDLLTGKVTIKTDQPEALPTPAL
jgi:type I restriction enzyme, S subunit